jgi:hypothetical protein
MVDITQTAANVGLTANSSATVLQTVLAGEALTQGQPVYLSAGKYYKADADAGLVNAAAVGICMSPAAADEYFSMAVAGAKIDLGATLGVGSSYVVSGTAGGIAPIADLATGDWVTHIGTASLANEIELVMKATGSQVP